MKKFSLLLVMFMAALAFTACDKDDDDNFSIVGTWEQEKMEMTVDFGLPGVEDMVETDTTPTTIVFNEGGTGTARYEEDGQPVTDNFNWSLTNDVLTIIDSETSLALKLTTMTNTRLVGEQTLTIQELAEFSDLTEEERQAMEMFSNLTAKIVVTLVKQ